MPRLTSLGSLKDGDSFTTSLTGRKGTVLRVYSNAEGAEVRLEDPTETRVLHQGTKVLVDGDN